MHTQSSLLLCLLLLLLLLLPLLTTTILQACDSVVQLATDIIQKLLAVGTSAGLRESVRCGNNPYQKPFQDMKASCKVGQSLFESVETAIKSRMSAPHPTQTVIENVARKFACKVWNARLGEIVRSQNARKGKQMALRAGIASSGDPSAKKSKKEESRQQEEGKKKKKGKKKGGGRKKKQKEQEGSNPQAQQQFNPQSQQCSQEQQFNPAVNSSAPVPTTNNQFNQVQQIKIPKKNPACLSCYISRQSCDGQRPCFRCANANRECQERDPHVTKRVRRRREMDGTEIDRPEDEVFQTDQHASKRTAGKQPAK